MEKMLYVAFTVAALVGMTNANARAAVTKRGGVCIGLLRGGDLVLQCEHISKVTIKQVHEKGFHVMYMQDDKNTATYAMLVIEEQ